MSINVISSSAPRSINYCASTEQCVQSSLCFLLSVQIHFYKSMLHFCESPLIWGDIEVKPTPSVRLSVHRLYQFVLAGSQLGPTGGWMWDLGCVCLPEKNTHPCTPLQTCCIVLTSIHFSDCIYAEPKNALSVPNPNLNQNHIHTKALHLPCRAQKSCKKREDKKGHFSQMTSLCWYKLYKWFSICCMQHKRLHMCGIFFVSSLEVKMASSPRDLSS